MQQHVEPQFLETGLDGIHAKIVSGSFILITDNYNHPDNQSNCVVIPLENAPEVLLNLASWAASWQTAELQIRKSNLLAELAAIDAKLSNTK